MLVDKIAVLRSHVCAASCTPLLLANHLLKGHLTLLDLYHVYLVNVELTDRT